MFKIQRSYKNYNFCEFLVMSRMFAETGQVAKTEKKTSQNSASKQEKSQETAIETEKIREIRHVRKIFEILFIT